MTRLISFSLLASVVASVVDWEQSGAIPGDKHAGVNNTRLLNTILGEVLQQGDTLVIPNKTFYVAGGIRAVGLNSMTIQMDGTLEFLSGRSGWPTQTPCSDKNPLQPDTKKKTCVQEAFFVANSTNITFTSNGVGTLNGNGESWWGYINYLVHGEDRPRLLSIINTTNINIERINFVNSAYWTFTALDVAEMEIKHCSIDNRVNHADGHGPLNLGAFNTDGFDVAGRDIYIHDCEVWNQDDCFTIQPLDSHAYNAKCTENVLIEDVKASGLGLTVGAVRPTSGHNCVRNVTFRRAYMHHTFKGIYIKGQNTADPNATGEISNILYEDVFMDSPSQVPIWIGPAQEADSYKACSLLWPTLKPPFASCPPPHPGLLWQNITLRNITIDSPAESPGLVYGNGAQPMVGLSFEHVVVTGASVRSIGEKKPWGTQFYKCEGVRGIASAGTFPVPPCFQNSSDV